MPSASISGGGGAATGGGGGGGGGRKLRRYRNLELHVSAYNLHPDFTQLCPRLFVALLARPQAPHWFPSTSTDHHMTPYQYSTPSGGQLNCSRHSFLAAVVCP
jgi:hypothetical protein